MRGEAGLVQIATWIGGGCAIVAAACGFFAGFVYTLDQGDPAYALLFGAVGLIVGAALGIINAMAPVFVLVMVDGWRWAGAAPFRALSAAVAAAAPSGALYLLLAEEPELTFIWFGTALTALPAAVATCCMDVRVASPRRGSRTQTAVGQ